LTWVERPRFGRSCPAIFGLSRETPDISRNRRAVFDSDSNRAAATRLHGHTAVRSWVFDLKVSQAVTVAGQQPRSAAGKRPSSQDTLQPQSRLISECVMPRIRNRDRPCARGRVGARENRQPIRSGAEPDRSRTIREPPQLRQEPRLPGQGGVARIAEERSIRT